MTASAGDCVNFSGHWVESAREYLALNAKFNKHPAKILVDDRLRNLNEIVETQKTVAGGLSKITYARFGKGIH